MNITDKLYKSCVKDASKVHKTNSISNCRHCSQAVANSSNILFHKFIPKKSHKAFTVITILLPLHTKMALQHSRARIMKFYWLGHSTETSVLNSRNKLCQQKTLTTLWTQFRLRHAFRVITDPTKLYFWKMSVKFIKTVAQSSLCKLNILLPVVCVL